MSNAYCSVPQCNSWAKRNPEIHFHLFPEAEQQRVFVESKLGNRELVDRRKVWIRNFKIGKPVSKYMRVCSLHFKPDDYVHKGKTILKKNAVPTLKLPTHGSPQDEILNLPSHVEENAIPGPSKRSQRLNKRNEVKENNSSDEAFICDNEEELEDFQNEIRNPDEIQAAESLLQLLNLKPEMLPNNAGLRTFRDFEVQVNMPEVKTVCDLITTDQTLNSFTGLNSLKFLEVLVQGVEKIYTDKRTHRLGIKERVVLVLCKLKTNLTYSTLSVLFSISAELCSNYIFEMLSILSQVLKSVIRFPPAEEIKEYMPICFRDFQNVRVVLDCTEIFVQTPKCLCCRVRFYSHYKSHLTVKFMTGVSPGGNITFISKPYGGRASDKVIFENSGIVAKLTPGEDAIMVDKGFLIDDMCKRLKIELIRPPFLVNQKQLSAQDAIRNKRIAAARVHIERSNQRIKTFKILSDKLQWSLVPKIKEIMIIICGITNLSHPILADSRFLTTENNLDY